jgi:hypothetical protein
MLNVAGLWIRIRIRIGSVFNRVCESGSVFGIRIRPGGQKLPTKVDNNL